MNNQRRVMGSVRKAVIFLLLQVRLINGFSWRSVPKVELDTGMLTDSSTAGGDLSQLLRSGSRLPSSYEVTLKELRELESEPLCHRTAARLLVNNCEVLEGKNEASVLTESGRKIRDFVDSYAASLAICDLERGSFQIPRECANFRESVLSQLPIRNQHILLFQRLTKIMGRFTDDIDKKFEQRMNDLDIRAQATSGRIDELFPKETTDAVSLGAQNAVNLQKMLEVVLKSVFQGQAEVVSSYEHSMQLANKRAESAIDTAIQAIAVVTESAAHLRTQLELSRLQAMELESRQANLEEGMQRLIGITENLAVKYDDHTSLLHQARNITNDILETLEDTAAEAANVGNSILKQSSVSSWWPYVWCPAASLVLGSYGLPPSAMRNLALLTLGEVAGLTISSIQLSAPTIKLSTLLHTWGHSFPKSSSPSNTASQPELL
ncbi:hypothetical protein F4813DRAFT_400985 [Daldinia decipiens]|uniref:uncharacterized protein n=1 Tax=Daldinia decipiens TaxID=326647 RepID=UPI0020C4DF36|nr:uncharacterized protein F4813DRAFT_400985 [Daldinia decipiens]KAI1652488.1 hypothetical protein F4813DRAFT_400985 [Daldinia decipiens]